MAMFSKERFWKSNPHFEKTFLRLDQDTIRKLLMTHEALGASSCQVEEPQRSGQQGKKLPGLGNIAQWLEVIQSTKTTCCKLHNTRQPTAVGFLMKWNFLFPTWESSCKPPTWSNFPWNSLKTAHLAGLHTKGLWYKYWYSNGRASVEGKSRKPSGCSFVPLRNWKDPWA